MKKFLWGVMTFLAIAIAGYAIVILTVADLKGHAFLGHHYLNRPIALYAHLGLGSLALMIGPFQFLKGLRTKRPMLHRWSGRLYVIFCLFSAVGGLMLALNSQQTMAKYGFIGLATVWVITTTQGYWMARAGNFSAHKNWMIRSYAATYAAVSLRFILPGQLIFGVPFETAYLVVSWACWVPNLLIAESIIRHKKFLGVPSLQP